MPPLPPFHRQLVAEHPQLVAADGGKLKQLAAALGLAPQQEAPLLLRAAEAAVSAGDPEKAESLLIQLAVQHFRWASGRCCSPVCIAQHTC